MDTGRYAPTPSGPQHLGNLRTALAAWLSARSAGSGFLLRIDDLDPERSSPRWAARHLEELESIGLTWDSEPLRQSERSDAYEAAVTLLRERGLIYECFCTRREIREAASAPHGELPEGAYPGTCRELSAAERRTHEEAGRPAALRVRAEEARVGFEDAIHGRSEGLVDDFVVKRNDGTHGYNLATVADDAYQGVSEVVRGDDLLHSTPRHLWLAERLGLSAPARWMHLPLVLGSDGERLAKRHGAVTLDQLEGEDVSAAEVRDLLAHSLGLCERGEMLTPEALVERYELARLPREPGPLPA